jgi:hypothetical protein
MAKYKDSLNFVDHDFTSITATYNGTDKVEGLDSIEVEMDDDENTITDVSDGTGNFNFNPGRKGTIRIGLLEASATSDIFWDARDGNAQFSLAVNDANAEKFKVSGQKCKIMKPPVITRRKEQEVVVWEFKCVYLEARGGSYKIAAA